MSKQSWIMVGLMILAWVVGVIIGHRKFPGRDGAGLPSRHRQSKQTNHEHSDSIRKLSTWHCDIRSGSGRHSVVHTVLAMDFLSSATNNFWNLAFELGLGLNYFSTR